MRFSILKVLRQTAALFLVYALPVATMPAGASPYGLGQAAPTTDTQPATIPPDQLDSLVAPIALYPDPLLAQMLAASTYPLEIIQLQQFMDNNKSLTGQALTNAVMKENWDPSVQAMAAVPDALKVLSENIKWTTDLGNAFLAQENDVMDAVQRMRLKAQGNGQLKTSQQQTVETKVVESKTVVVIQPSSPDVIYVPSYDPMVVYGAPAYPYPPVYYPGYVAGRALWFGAGLAIGAAWGHGGWGWGCGWGGGYGGHNNITINNNNNFINNSNRQNVSNRPGAGGSGTQWQHNSQHRGGTPYGDRSTANKYGGTTRGDSMANRQATARQQGQFGGQGQGGRQQGGFQGSGAGNFGGGAGGADRVGNRDVSRGSGGGAFGGASTGMSGRDTRASQSRGSSSMSSRGGGSGGGAARSSGGGRSGGGGGRRR
jgi:hypothetical protein